MRIEHILLVDDDEGDLFLACLTIRRFDDGIKVSQARDGAEALAMVTEQGVRPDVILLDINMPGMGGLEFLEHYSKLDDQPSVVVMLSSSDQLRDRERSSRHKFARRYIVKPLSADDLQELILLDAD